MKNEKTQREESELLDRKINTLPVTRDAFTDYIIQARNSLFSMTEEILDEIRSLEGKQKIDAWAKCVKVFNEINPASIKQNDNGVGDIERLLMEEAEIVEEIDEEKEEGD